MEVVKIEFLNAANNAESKLVEDVSALDNSVQVLNPNIFPDPPFLISIENEILRVNEVQNGVFMNIDRGVEGTTPASHSAGSSVENRYTAGMYHSVAGGVNKVAGDLELHKGKMATDDTAGHIRLSDIPTPPVTSVNSKTGAVSLNATDVGAETPAGAQAKVNAVRQDLETHKADNAAHDKIIVTGEYVGDNASSREIVLGFQPNIVIMYQLNGNRAVIQTYYRHGDYGCRIRGGSSARFEGASASNRHRAPLITPNGFLVGYSGSGTDDTNYAPGPTFGDYTYVYMAIR